MSRSNVIIGDTNDSRFEAIVEEIMRLGGAKLTSVMMNRNPWKEVIAMLSERHK